MAEMSPDRDNVVVNVTSSIITVLVVKSGPVQEGRSREGSVRT